MAARSLFLSLLVIVGLTVSLPPPSFSSFSFSEVVPFTVPCWLVDGVLSVIGSATMTQVGLRWMAGVILGVEMTDVATGVGSALDVSDGDSDAIDSGTRVGSCWGSTMEVVAGRCAIAGVAAGPLGAMVGIAGSWGTSTGPPARLYKD